MSYKRFKYFNISKTKKIRFLSTKSASKIYVIFLHGFMSDIEGKKPITFLKFSYKKKINFLAFEYSGHGKSYGKFTNGNISKWTKDAHCLIKAKFKEKNFPVTLFVNTSTISKNNKNYLNWDEIRMLKSEGVTIGAHSHTHNHMPDLSIEEKKNEIEISNKIFLKELGLIPSLFAYPYGEADEKTFELLKEYKFKVAFGQHSGVINETSNMYYLPRFSLNEKYGEIDRVIFAATTKGLGVYDFIPSNPTISENPPYIGFSVLDQTNVQSLNCFVFDSEGQVEKELFKFTERIEIRLARKLNKGRSRINCTTKDKEGNWRWYGHQFYL